MYAKIIVDIANGNVDRLFTYRLPFPLEIGQRVLVPFGKGDKTVEGFVLELCEETEFDKSRIKDVIRTLEPYPVIDKEQLELCEWITKKYHTTMAQALRLMLPAQLRGLRVHEKQLRCVKLSDALDAKAYLASLVSKDGKIRKKGAYNTVEFLSKVDISVLTTDLYELAPGCSSAVLKRLIDDGIVVEEYKTVYRRPKIVSEKKSPIPALTCEQKKAYDSICKGLNTGFCTYLLHGVTGSGKTEVYMNAIEQAISQNRGAIVLVPEISLTPQTVSRFNARFKGNVAVLHSRLSAGERFDEWRRIRKGEVKVVVGARSAVFAPVKNIGIIVIDEEHESSYISETAPRYNAIEVAKKRCKISGGVLVLGSATPSVNTYFRAKMGKITLLELKNRVNNKPMPKIEVVDMRSEVLNGNTSLFSARLSELLKECHQKGEQAILFLNRRGYSSFVSCRACGYVFKCDSCDVSMTYHKSGGKLRCHYCGNEKSVPKICPNCKRSYLKYSGIGTEQIEEELKRLIPGVSCIRMDRDTTQGKDSHTKLLSEFSKGEASVLIGTQMIAKGLDFPNVTLVGVISVDSMLSMPDFRNTERTFQLLTQVAGRAGRADKSGFCVLQTTNPDHPIIELAKSQNFDAFYEYVISGRQKNMYPPYSVFVRTLFSGDDDMEVKRESIAFLDGVYDKIIDLIKERGGERSQILFAYAMPAPIRRLQNKQRHHVLMKLAITRDTAAIIDCIYAFAKQSGIGEQCQIEINPNEML